MQRILLVSILAVLLGGFFAPLLAADNNADRNQDNSFVKFRGGIGVVPISNVAVDANNAVTVTRNMVRGVNSPGQIWRIEDLDARIKSNGDIKVLGEGLLLAGGNNIGTNAGQSVAAQLFCGDQLSHRLACRLRLTATSKSMRYSPLCRYPATCETPALLIRSINLTTGALSGFGSPWGFPTSMIMIGIEPR